MYGERGSVSTMTALQVACISCSRTFDAVRNAGLVRCAPCEDRQAFSLPSAGDRVTTFDTPGEAWA
jgi:LSD1 subclass zinc finger protein